VIFIQRRLHEPKSWQNARDAAAAGTGKRLGSYADLFGGGWVTRHAVLAMLLAFVGVVGLWGIGFFTVDLTQMVLALDKDADALGLDRAGTGRLHRGAEDHLRQVYREEADPPQPDPPTNASSMASTAWRVTQPPPNRSA